MKKKLIILIAIISVLFVTACNKKFYLEKYVSECRYNILTGIESDYRVNANLTTKEYPYIVDGAVGTVQSFIEIFLYTPDNTATYDIYFEKDGKKYGGEMNYNSGRSRQELTFEYADKTANSIDFIVTVAEDSFLITALSVIKTEILSPEKALGVLYNEETTLFESLTDHGNFLGEIQIRLLFESDKNYYFIGVVDRQGKIHAFLLLADNGKIIARKEITYKIK